MLLRFGVENHLSIQKRQELSFAASSLRDQKDGLISCAAVTGGAVIPSAIIYGANASGKTNFLNALSTMQQMVLWSQIRGTPGGGVLRHEFRLDPACAEKASCFDVDFMIDGIRYHYGFEASDEAFVSEWLYEIPKAHRRKLYERDGARFDFGRHLQGRNRSVAELTRPNSLFLSAAAQLGHPQLSGIYTYFKDMAFMLSPSVNSNAASNIFTDADEATRERAIRFLRAIDTGVVGYKRSESEISEKDLEIKRELWALVQKISGIPNAEPPQSLDERNEVSIELSHRGAGGESIPLGLDWESAGTIRLLPLLVRAYRALDQGRPLIVDELDASLHTRAAEALVKLFSGKQNGNRAQLVATVHDTNLLRSNALRRDQIWFAEKGAEGATEIYPLTDIRTRRGDNLELGYLQGRYGAVPMNDPLETIPGSP